MSIDLGEKIFGFRIVGSDQKSVLEFLSGAWEIPELCVSYTEQIPRSRSCICFQSGGAGAIEFQSTIDLCDCIARVLLLEKKNSQLEPSERLLQDERPT